MLEKIIQSVFVDLSLPQNQNNAQTREMDSMMLLTYAEVFNTLFYFPPLWCVVVRNFVQS